MDEAELHRWFGEYLEAYAACGRGETDPVALLSYYGVPLLLSTDSRYAALTSEVWSLEITPLNAATALCQGQFTRRRADGSELNQLAVTYLIASSDAGHRISVLAVHTEPDS